ETAFAALHTHLVVPGIVSLETLLERMSDGPARVFGLGEPRIEAGAGANLHVLALAAEAAGTEDGFRSLSAKSGLRGEAVTGRVAKPVAEGGLVDEAVATGASCSGAAPATGAGPLQLQASRSARPSSPPG